MKPDDFALYLQWRSCRMRTMNLLLSIAFFAASCAVNASMLEGRGTVRYIPIEGGFYGIVCDDGKNYDPTNLPPEFQQDNLKVGFTGKILKDRVGFHMWGEIIEIKDISRSE